MNPKVIPRRGKRGRYRWVAQDMDANNIGVGMSPRDWPTGEDAVRAGEKLLNVRAEAQKAQHVNQVGKLKAENDRMYNKLTQSACDNTRLEADKRKLERDLSIVQAMNATLVERQVKDKRGVIIAYTVVAAGIIIGVAIAAFNSI